MPSPPEESKRKIIVALDYSSAEQARALIRLLGDRIAFFKIGLQLFVAAGPDVMRAVHDSGARVFLDLKFHDIPNTVGHAVESALKLGADMLTVHASGGVEMARAASSARGKSGCKVLGVTVLTSTDQATLESTGITAPLNDQVLRLALLARKGGLDGVVASPKEIALLRGVFGRQMIIVTPGVRPAGVDPEDQRRVMTPREAVSAGADYLVIGRPITAAKNPVAALDRILEEIE